MCPIVPTFKCGLLRSYFAFAIDESPSNNEKQFVVLFQDFLCNSLRDRCIVIKFHVEHTASLCCRAKLCCISKHFSERNQRTDGLCIARAYFHALDQATAAVDLSHNIAQVILRDHHLDLHHRLEQDGRPSMNAFLEAHRLSLIHI